MFGELKVQLRIPSKTGERAPQKGSHSLWSRNPDWPQALLGENPVHSVVTQTILSFVVMCSLHPVSDSSLCQTGPCVRQHPVSDSTLYQTAQHPVSDSTISCLILSSHSSLRVKVKALAVTHVSDNTLYVRTPSLCLSLSLPPPPPSICSLAKTSCLNEI